MKKRKQIVFIIIFFTLISVKNISAQESESKYTPGFIFNASNLLLNLDSYQGGIGLILRSSQDAWRFSAGVGYESSDAEFSSKLGVTYRRPFFTGKVSPYWGGTVSGSYNYDSDKTDADNWSKTNEIVIFVGLLLGVEFSLEPRVSFFAEYSLGVDVAWVTQEASVGGSVDTTGTNNWSIGTDLGNNGSIGVIIYLGKD